MFILIRPIVQFIIIFNKFIIAMVSKNRFINFLVDAIFIVFCLTVIGFFVKAMLICYEVRNSPFLFKFKLLLYHTNLYFQIPKLLINYLK